MVCIIINPPCLIKRHFDKKLKQLKVKTFIYIFWQFFCFPVAVASIFQLSLVFNIYFNTFVDVITNFLSAATISPRQLCDGVNFELSLHPSKEMKLVKKLY